MTYSIAQTVGIKNAASTESQILY